VETQNMESIDSVKKLPKVTFDDTVKDNYRNRGKGANGDYTYSEQYLLDFADCSTSIVCLLLCVGVLLLFPYIFGIPFAIAFFHGACNSSKHKKEMFEQFKRVFNSS